MEKDKQILELNRTINMLMAHPDNEPNSEFADRIDSLIELKEVITVTRCSMELPTEEEISVEIKKQLVEINKDKPVPSTKHDLGFCNGFLECYEFMTK